MEQHQGSPSSSGAAVTRQSPHSKQQQAAAVAGTGKHAAQASEKHEQAAIKAKDKVSMSRLLPKLRTKVSVSRLLLKLRTR